MRSSRIRRRGAGLLIAALLLSAGCAGDGQWEARLDAIIGDMEASAEGKIQMLEDYLDRKPPLEQASEARFTLGWLYAETLHQYAEARRWFSELVEKSPQGPWAENARWMIENMEKDPADLLPGLRKEGAPADTGYSEPTRIPPD